jgi:type III pantothenate kinase
MLLAIDIGNTQTVLGLYRADHDVDILHDELIAHWRIATEPAHTADQALNTLQGIFAFAEFALEDIDDVIIASVVPSLTATWQEAAQRFSKHEAFVVDAQNDYGLPIRYKNPDEIGADRIADALAAKMLYGAPVLVVDFGTATNIEVIDCDGAFLGGIIAPGVKTSAQALFTAAARLATVDIERPEHVIGQTTKDAVQSGLTYGEIDRIDGLVERVFEELGYRAPVVATGGLFSFVQPLSRTITHTDEFLTLKGLRIIYEVSTGFLDSSF